MGEIVGYVTRAAGFPGIGGSLPNDGTNPKSRNLFTTIKADGTFVASLATAQAAQRALESAYGGGRLIWTREPGTVERYAGRETSFAPVDYGRLLAGGAWWRPDRGVLSYPPDLRVRRWASPVDAGQTFAVQATAADQPRYVPEANAGRPAVRFDAVATEVMTTNLTIGVDLNVRGMMLGAVATWRPAGRDQVILQTPNLRFLVTAGGVIRVENGASTIDGPAAVAGQPFVIHGIWPPNVSVFGPTFYVNGVSFGTSPDLPADGLLTISDAVDAWHQDIQEVLAIPRFMVEDQADRFVAYAFRRYQIP